MNRHFLKGIIVFLVFACICSCTTMSPERKIWAQAIATGVGTGAVIGGTAGYLLGDESGAAIGAGCGAIVGGIAGWAVANAQIDKYKNITLQNEQLEKLLCSARQYNTEATTYNNQLRKEIAEIETKTKPDQAKIAKKKIKEVEAYRAQVKARITEREKLSATLVPAQRAQYEFTLYALKEEEKKMDEIIEKYQQLASEKALIG